MSTGIYLRKPLSENHKLNIGKAHKKLGTRPPSNKGIPHTRETKLKIGKANKGHIVSGETRKKISEANKGNPLITGRKKGFIVSEETKRKISLARMGRRKVTYKKPVIKNGKKYDPNWHIIRKEIYKRDKWICQECSYRCHNTMDKKIQCHHIDYNEKNNNPENLITLCASCHMKANFNRQEWINYYKIKIVNS